jgi:VWA domain-containing protein
MTNASNLVAARIRAGLVLLIAAVAVAGASAQGQITFFLSATSLTGEHIADLKPEDVSIAEDGKPATVVKMVPVNWPVKVTVLVDNGFETGQLLSQYRAGLKAFLAAMPSGVETSVITLAPQPRWLIRPTSDPEQLQKSVDRLVPDSQGSSRMVEGLIEAANRMEQENRKQVVHFPVIVLLSTTGPEGSTARESEVDKMARQFQTYPARVHVIMLSASATPGSLSGARQVHVGKSVADITGGRYEGIAAATRIPSLLVEFAEMIGDAHAFQSHQYMVTVQRPAGASGALGQMMAGPTRTGVRLTPTAQGLKP